jgi:hypothetical protein
MRFSLYNNSFVFFKVEITTSFVDICALALALRQAQVWNALVLE